MFPMSARYSASVFIVNNAHQGCSKCSSLFHTYDSLDCYRDCYTALLILKRTGGFRALSTMLYDTYRIRYLPEHTYLSPTISPLGEYSDFGSSL